MWVLSNLYLLSLILGEPLKEDVSSSTPTRTAGDSNPHPDDLEEDKEAFSDLEIGDSDEEILNKINPNENDEEGQLQVNKEVIFRLLIHVITKSATLLIFE